MTEQQEDPFHAAQLAAARKGRCPACGADHLIAGPRGGLSRNWYCDTCKSAWNMGHSSIDFRFRDVFFVQSIPWDESTVELYRV